MKTNASMPNALGELSFFNFQKTNLDLKSLSSLIGLLAIFLCSFISFGQQVWSEDFSGLTNGVTSDTGVTAWSTTITQGTITVQNGLILLQGDNAGTNATWISQEIDISNHTNIGISFLVGDSGIGEKEFDDYVKGFYILDNGTRQEFSNITDDISSPILQTITGLNGNSLRIEIDFRVSYGNETYTIDDMLVTGTSNSSNSNGNDLHSHSNAASVTNESNATIGWLGSGTRGTLHSVSDEVYSGSHSIKLQTNSYGWSVAKYSFDMEIGKQYIIKMHAKSASSTGGGFYIWEGFSDFQAQGMASTWQEHTFTLTASATTGLIKVYAGGTPSDLGDNVYFDNLSIFEVGTENSTPEPPTNLTFSPPNINSTNLSWIASTSSGVVGYKLYRNGNPTTLGNVTSQTINDLSTTSTETFVLKAIDGIGTESADSNLVTIDNTSTGGGDPGTTGGHWTKTGSNVHYSLGNVGIGTTAITNYKLAVDGNIRSREVKVDNQSWPDYVFASGYKLPKLSEVKQHIKENGHLFNIPSAKEVEANGFELGEMNKLLLEKIEELTLYIIQQEKRIQNLETQTKK